MSQQPSQISMMNRQEQMNNEDNGVEEEEVMQQEIRGSTQIQVKKLLFSQRIQAVMEYMGDEEERLEMYMNLISNGLLNDLAIKIKE